MGGAALLVALVLSFVGALQTVLDVHDDRLVAAALGATGDELLVTGVLSAATSAALAPALPRGSGRRAAAFLGVVLRATPDGLELWLAPTLLRRDVVLVDSIDWSRIDRFDVGRVRAGWRRVDGLLVCSRTGERLEMVMRRHGSAFRYVDPRPAADELARAAHALGLDVAGPSARPPVRTYPI